MDNVAGRAHGDAAPPPGRAASWGPARWVAPACSCAAVAALAWLLLDHTPENQLVAGVLVVAAVLVAVAAITLVMVVALALVMVFPQIALWLPDYIYGR